MESGPRARDIGGIRGNGKISEFVCFGRWGWLTDTKKKESFAALLTVPGRSGCHFTLIAGPGCMAMLADTDADSIVTAAGITSGALIASIVVSLAAAWGVSEMFGAGKSFNMSMKDAPGFYAAYACGIIAAGLFVVKGSHLVELTILVEIVNTLMLPLILGFLFLLAVRLLPAAMRVKRWERAMLISIYVTLSVLSVFTVVNMIVG